MTIPVIPEKINDWQEIAPIFDALLAKDISSVTDFNEWLEQISQLESRISEDLAWRYIKMTCNTEDTELEQAYLFFVSEIEPKIAPFGDKLNKKLNELKGSFLIEDMAHGIYFRRIERAIALFREENIALFAQIQTEAQKYGVLNAAMTVEWNGKELTLQQMSRELKSTDRETRKKAFEKIQTRRYTDHEKLDDLLDELIKLRTKVAQQAGYVNFRDYQHDALNRFDYSVADCERFHTAVEEVVVPLQRQVMQKRLHKLGYGEIRPWDTEVDLESKEPLHPFDNGEELANKSIEALGQLDPFFGEVISTMKQRGQLDLDSRKGKAPGGYNYPLAVTGYPFIFMNAASSQRDVETMVHEAGHAIHSVLTKDLRLNAFKEFPSEVAELASMSMELLSMETWKVFYEHPDDLKRAKLEQLEGIIKTLPWIAQVDAFQHWLYTNPYHTREERAAQWLALSDRFGSGLVNWDGYEHWLSSSWQRQLHIFEVPFYYIEYGFAQLGAVGVWKNYVENGNQAIDQYKQALSLGYTQSIPEIYKSAGVKFDFSPSYITSLFEFLQSQIEIISSE